MTNIAMEKSPFFIGKPSINGPFSMAMLNNQRVNIHVHSQVGTLYWDIKRYNMFLAQLLGSHPSHAHAVQMHHS